MRRIITLLWILFWAAGTTAAEPRRNFVFIIVDDLGWRDLGCFGSSFYETPNIDRLARTATSFSNAYAASPVCSPTRASILVGKYPARLGITDYINPNGGNQPEKWSRPTVLLPAPYADRLKLDEVTIAERLRDAGYATFFAGKWHLGPQGFWPEDQGFQFNFGGTEKGGPYGGDKYFSPYDNPRLSDGPPGEHLPDRLAHETVAFIEAHRESPFFAYLSFYSVHTPLMARADLEEKYVAKNARIRFAGPAWGKERSRQVRLIQNHAVYAAMVQAMDEAVGRVLSSLQQLGLADETVVIFVSDNGGLATSEGHPTSNLPLRAGKGWLYEGGIRVPLIIRAPGVTQPGAHSDSVVCTVDFLPTMLELASLPLPAGERLDGVSFVPALRGEPFDRGSVYWHYPHYGNQGGAPGGAIRDGRWKLIHWYENDQTELFDLDSDIGEQQDLSNRQTAVRDQLFAGLQQWNVRMGAAMPSKRE